MTKAYKSLSTNKKTSTIEKSLAQIQHQLKLMEEKNNRIESKLMFEIMSQGTKTRKNLESTFAAEIAVAVQESNDNLDKKLTEFSDKMFTRIDPILAEVENARIDRELTTEKFQKLEKRVDKIEKIIN